MHQHGGTFLLEFSGQMQGIIIIIIVANNGLISDGVFRKL